MLFLNSAFVCGESEISLLRVANRLTAVVLVYATGSLDLGANIKPVAVSLKETLFMDRACFGSKIT